jgi:hypothetical protein
MTDNQITNGDFELGDFTGWILTGGCIYECTIIGDGAHSGTYKAWIGYNGCSNCSCEISQTLVNETPVEQVLEFSMWVTCHCSGGTRNIYVLVTYTDESTTLIENETTWDEWEKVDMTANLASGKTIKSIAIYTSRCSYSLDDVSLLTASVTVSVDTQTVTDLVPPTHATFHGEVEGTGGIDVTKVGFDYKYEGDDDWISIVDDVTEVIPYSFSKEIINRIYYKKFSYRAKAFADGKWHYGWVLYYESCFMNIANATRSHCFERILNLKISQTVDVATRPVPTREDGEVVDTGTYVIHALQVTFDSRLTDAEKTVIQAMLDDHLTITLYLGNWTFSDGWFVSKGVVWEYVSDDELNIRPWKCSFNLIFESVAYAP